MMNLRVSHEQSIHQVTARHRLETAPLSAINAMSKSIRTLLKAVAFGSTVITSTTRRTEIIGIAIRAIALVE